MKPLYLAKSFSELETKCSINQSVDPSKVDEKPILKLFEEAANLQNSDEEKAFIFYERGLNILNSFPATTLSCISFDLKGKYEMAKKTSKKLRENLSKRYEVEQTILFLDNLIVCNDPIIKEPFKNQYTLKEVKHFPGNWMPPSFLHDKIDKKENIFLVDLRTEQQYSRRKISEVPQFHFGGQIFSGQTVTTFEKRMNVEQRNQWKLHKSAEVIILLDEDSGSELIDRPDKAENIFLSRGHPLKKMYDALVTYNADKMSLPSTVFLSGGFLEFEKRYPSLISITPISSHSSVTPKSSVQIGYPTVLDNNKYIPSNDLQDDEDAHSEPQSPTSSFETLSYHELGQKLRANQASAVSKFPSSDPLSNTTNSQLHKPTIDRSTKPQRNVSPTFDSQPKLENGKKEKISAPNVNRSTKPQIAVKSATLTSITASSINPDIIVPKSLRRGLVNMGNTCYMNSILQCLLHTPRLWQFFTKSKNFRGKLARSFADFVIEMSDSQQPTAYLPKALKENFDRLHPVFADGQQQDSHEFLIVLLDSLHEELNRSKEKLVYECFAESEDASSDKMADLSWRRNRTRDDSVILDLFNGQLQSKVQCLTCSRCSYAFDEFMYLSVSIQSTAFTDLMKCIKQFFESENLTGESRWLCPQCKTPSEAVKTFCVCRFPKYLIIHLKRFHCYKACQKIDSYVQFPLTGLNISAFAKIATTTSDFKYDLYGVINHHGSVDSGHYTAFSFDSNARKWYNFDDSRVTELPETEVQTRAVYVLFYRRSEVPTPTN